MSTETQSTQSKPKTIVHPLVDIFEADAEFLLVADLPGVDKDSLELVVEGGELRVTAESEHLAYRRSFSLGEEVDLDAIVATLEHGELKLHLPKRAEARVRRITVAS